MSSSLDQGPIEELAKYFRRYLRALALFLAISISYPLTLLRILPMYAAHREAFPKICSLTGLIAFALASSWGVLCLHRKSIRFWPGIRIFPSALLFPAALTTLGMGLLAGCFYLPLLEASIKIRTATVVATNLSVESEYADVVRFQLDETSGIQTRLATAKEFLSRLRIDPSDWRSRILSSKSETPYGNSLLVLNTMFVVLTEIGLFFLALCNVLVFASKANQKERR